MMKDYTDQGCSIPKQNTKDGSMKIALPTPSKKGK